MNEKERPTQLTNAGFVEYYPQIQYIRDRIIGNAVSGMIKGWDRNGKILVPGCGNGGTMIDLNMKFFPFSSIYGIDVNIDALRGTRMKENRLGLADIGEMPFLPKTFDYAVISDVIQDWDDYKVLVTRLKEIARVVKNKGQVLVTNPTAKSYLTETILFDCLYQGNEGAVKVGMGAEVKGKLKSLDRSGKIIKHDFIDYVWRDSDLERAFLEAGLKRLRKARPKARDDSRRPEWIGVHDWISETRTAPWVVYLLEVK